MKTIDLKVRTEVEWIYPCTVPDDFDADNATDAQLEKLLDDFQVKRYHYDETEATADDVVVLK